MSALHQLSRQFESLAHEVWPVDLQGVEIHVVFARHAPEQFRGNAVGGITGPMLSNVLGFSDGTAMLSNVLGFSDGAAIILNDADFVPNAARSRRASRMEAKRYAAAVFAHELSHVVAENCWRDYVPEIPRELVVRAYSRAMIGELPAIGTAIRDRADLDCHVPSWMRCAIHTWSRLRSLGHDFLLADPSALISYPWMPSGWKLAAILRDECEKLKDLSWAEVLSIQPPADFAVAGQAWLAELERIEQGEKQ